MNQTTRQIICDARAGNPVAFDALVRGYQNRAVGCAYARLRDWGRAEDAAQDALLQAWRDLPMLQTVEAFPGWLRRIVHKHCDRQTRRFDTATTSLHTLENVAEAQSDPAHIYQKAERQEMVQQAIGELPDGEREVVILFYINERSVSEAAEFLQITPPTVRKRLQRARMRLRERIMAMELVENTVQAAAPSRDTRFAEGTALLRRITDGLQQNENVVAAFLAHSGESGEDDGFGIHDDAWSSLNVHVVVRDEAMDALATGRKAFVAGFGNLLLYEEAHQNAPAQGYYLMALYDGAAGPYQVDWYWYAQSRTMLPTDTRLLFDKVGLPQGTEPRQWRYLREDEYPVALRQLLAARTPDEVRRDEGRNQVSLFWAMLLISAKFALRHPNEERIAFAPMLMNLRNGVAALAGLEERKPDAPSDIAPSTPDKGAKIALLRGYADDMAALMPKLHERGLTDLQDAVVPRAYQFLQLARG